MNQHVVLSSFKQLSFTMTLLNSLEWFMLSGIVLVCSNIVSGTIKHYGDYLTVWKACPDALSALYDGVSLSVYIFIALSVVVSLLSCSSMYISILMTEKLSSRLRSLFFQALPHQDIGFFDQPGNTPSELTAELSTLVTKVASAARHERERE
ncbi:ABC transporter B member 10 [Aphanomyces cochlioides]|nr:ABC transporter B member 10 [Aphanomyces cochlioides]